MGTFVQFKDGALKPFLEWDWLKGNAMAGAGRDESFVLKIAALYYMGGLTQEDIDSSRDLRGESKVLDASLNKNKSVEFTNDARRK